MTHELPPINGAHGAGGPTPADIGLTPAELAALYVAGALEDAERLDFERRLRAGEPACVEALREVAPALRAVLDAAGPQEPPAQARRVIEARLGMALPPAASHEQEHEHAHAGESDHGVTFIRREQIQWRPTGLPGIRQCVLLADKKGNRRSVLYDIRPGTHLPDHAHAGIEEVMVLEGDLSVGNVKLGPRDYFCAQPDARHGELRSETGCIALVFSSYGSITTRTRIGFALDALWTLLRGGGNKSA
jgi:anti-sigma factor ChrR (cupin superfamily)